MSKKGKEQNIAIDPSEDKVELSAEAAEQLMDGEPAVPADDGNETGAVDLEAELDAKAGAYEELKDRHLRLVADFDNFRKRTAKQMSESGTAAQAFLITRLLDALDDLGRVAHLDPEKTEAGDILSGVEMVEKKILKELEGVGLEKLGVVGEPFDPNLHEAIGTVPVEEETSVDTVATVLQMGYRVGTVLLRPAMVQVYM